MEIGLNADSFPFLSELIIFSILLSFISVILSIVWIIFVIKLESYCTLMQKAITFLFSIRVLLMVLLSCLLILVKLDHEVFFIALILNTINIVTKSLFLIILFLAASGWMSIRFSKIFNEIKMNYSVYLYILLYLNSSICSIFFFKGKLIQPYDYCLMLYLIFIIYTSNRSYHTLKEKYAFLIEIQEDFNKCFKIKKYRFTMISWLCLSYLIIYTITIWLDNMYSEDKITNVNFNFGNVIRIIVDSIIITLFLVLFKPSSIILRDHVNPNRNVSNPVSYFYFKGFLF